ncbi:MAG: tRNA lysidine(34) synthetase TilS [Acidobacteria bacterium]|nr:MAG: tRNA lysidine(34) synthetase TilS [Acidobacteriota bacterium]
MPTRHFRNERLSGFDRLLFAEWRKLRLPTSGETVVVAVSGGADSTALLLSVAELIKVGKLRVTVCVAHLDHGLRAASKKDAAWVRSLAKGLGFDVVVGRAKVAEQAQADSENLEQAARNARYEFLERTAKRRGAHIVLSAHTMDDQAETVLLRLMRGSAGFGLSGMEAQRSIVKAGKVQLIRPLLWARRAQTEDYCRLRKVEYLSDEMNDNERFARVKVRKQLVPLMKTFNNKVVEALSRTAHLLREDNAILVESADELLEKATENSPNRTKSGVPSLNVSVLASAPSALRRRALRKWISNGRGSARRLEMVHLVAVEKLIEGEKGGRVVELPTGSSVTRKRGWLEFNGKND